MSMQDAQAGETGWISTSKFAVQIIAINSDFRSVKNIFLYYRLNLWT